MIVKVVLCVVIDMIKLNDFRFVFKYFIDYEVVKFVKWLIFEFIFYCLKDIKCIIWFNIIEN